MILFTFLLNPIMKTRVFRRKNSGNVERSEKRRLKIVFEKGTLLETGIDRFVAGGDFQIFGVFDKQVDKPALGTDPRLEGNLFLDAMVLADDHDQFQILAGT
jgi:hypothetical protein